MPTLRTTAFASIALIVALSTGFVLALHARHVARDSGHAAVAVTRASEPSPADICQQRRDALLEEPALSGVPNLEAARHVIMARARAEPVMFLDPPTVEALPPRLARLRERLHTERDPWQALHDARTQLAGHPKLLRQVVLTDGYLYAEAPNLAALLASMSLSQLFSEPELDVTRGDEIWRAARKGPDYVWANGPEAGHPARLWLFDRVVVRGEHPSAPKHVSISDVYRQTSATRVEIERLSHHGARATLIYGDERVPALLSIENGRLRLGCEVIRPESVASVEGARSLNQRRNLVLERLRKVISEQVQEALPFDEPKTEEGQQDGWLRFRWRAAYQSGQQSFEFNGDEYPVFGAGGTPRTPQVCIDFITDSWERMAGTHWASRGEGRHRHIGRLDLDALGAGNRRRVTGLIDFAVAHSEWFETKLVPDAERIRFADRASFFQQLFLQRDEYQPGDVIAILGPRNDDKLHYHSFFIFAADPVTGMPTLVAANAGRPRIRTWEGEMQNAPLRSIVARIRPRLEWLEAIAGTTERRELRLVSI